jgi:phosphoribosyl 1,2-cyclic phosphodiesterase
LASGSSGNCVYLASPKTRLLIDIGLSCKMITERLESIGVRPEMLDAILITHEHSDHCQGLSTICKRWRTPILASSGTWRNLDLPFDLSSNRRIDFIPGQRIGIGDLNVIPFELPHDANMPTGFRIEGPTTSFALATDLGHLSENVRRQLEGVEVLVFESNHDIEMLRLGPYPAYLKRRILSQRGHLSNDQSGESLSELVGKHTKAVFLAHLSKQNNRPDLAWRSAYDHLRAAGCNPGQNFELLLTHRDRPTDLFQLR